MKRTTLVIILLAVFVVSCLALTACTPKYTVTWQNWDGTVLEVDVEVEEGTIPTYDGATPTKQADAQYTYEFSGWDKTVTAVMGETVYTAQFNVILNSYTVTWLNWDGTVLKTDVVEYGETPTYTGSTPTKEGNAQYTYTFTGWDPTVDEVTGNITYVAQFSHVTNKYTVTWQNWDGSVLELDEGVEYGTMPSYDGSTPTKGGNAQYTYTFTGWTPSINIVTGDVSYTAQFLTEVNEYTVTWQNWDGSVLEIDENVEYGKMPSYDGETPTKGGNAQYTYTFTGWTPSINIVTGDVSYTAQFLTEVNEYTVTWQNWDGTVLELDESVEFGATPSYDGATPTRERDAQYTYTFSGWEPSVDSVTGNVTYVAQYSTEINMYTVTWQNWDGSVLEIDEYVEYGTMPSYDGAIPVRAEDAQYTYVFNSWNEEVSNVTGDVTYTAQFNQYIHYSITYNLDGGENNSANPTYYTILLSETITLLHPTKTGYTFAGWTYADQITPQLDVSITQGTTGDKEYTANWQANKYTVTYEDTITSVVVTFDYNYAGSTSSIVVLSHGQTLDYPAPPTRDGYAFAGWCTNSDCTTQYTFSSAITEDITLYAKWVSMASSYTYREYVDIANYAAYFSRKSITASSHLTNNYYYFTCYKSGTYEFDVWWSSGFFYVSVYNVTKGSSILSSYKLTPSIKDKLVSFTAEAGDVIYVTIKDYNQYNGTGCGSFYVYGASYPTSAAIAQIPYNYSVGSSVSETATFDSSFELFVPTRQGYTFLGWYNGEDKFESGTWNFTSDITLSADWQVNKYTITLDGNGVELPETSIPITYGEEYILPEPTRPGYTFLGWYNGTELVGSGTWERTCDISIKAKWQANTYTLTYKDIYNESYNYGYNRNVTVTFGSSFQLLDPHRTGYTFLGWYNGEDKFESGTWNFTSDITLSANWSLDTYSISYELFKGINDSSNPSTYTTIDSFVLQEASKDYYTFDGWYTDPEFKNKITDLNGHSGNLTLYAKFTPYSYEATFDVNGGIISNTLHFHFYEYISATGYYVDHFEKKWNSDVIIEGANCFDLSAYLDSFTEKELMSYKYVSKISLYEDYSVSLPLESFTAAKDLDIYVYIVGRSMGSTTPGNYFRYYPLQNGIKVNEYAPYNMKVSNATVVEQQYELPTVVPTLYKNGYQFMGWYDESGKIIDELWTYTTDKAFHAKWSIAVTLDSNGGEVDKDSVTVYYGQEFTLPTPTRTDYTFEGWFDGATEYQSGVWNYDPVAVLVAKWTVNTYAITYNLNEGENSPNNPTSYTAFDDITLSTPIRPGYTFLGWTGSNGDVPQVDVSFSGTTRCDLEYTAHWELAIFNVEYVLNGGINPSKNPTQITVLDEFALKDATRTGYTFDGWYLDEEFTLPITTLTNIVSDITLYARFIPNQYEATFVDNSPTGTFDSIVLSLKDGAKNIANITIKDGEVYNPYLTIPTKTGYIFEGWYLGSTKILSPIVTEKDITLTAKWISQRDYLTTNTNVYHRYYDSGTSTEYLIVPSNCNRIYVKLFATSYSNFNESRSKWLSGYASISNQTPGSEGLRVSANIITPNTAGQVITNREESAGYLNVNPGDILILSASGYNSGVSVQFVGYQTAAITNSPQERHVTFNYDDEFSLVAPKVSRAGCELVGWVDKNGNIASGKWNYTSEQTFTAKWEIINYTIKYVLDGGVNSPFNPGTYTVHDTIELQAPTKEGCTFEGWYLDSSFTQEITSIDYTTGDYTLYAKFTPNSYTANLDFDGGTSSPTVTFISDGEVVDSLWFTGDDNLSSYYPPAKEGYMFGGWYLDESCQNVFNFLQVITEDITLYARWISSDVMCHKITSNEVETESIVVNGTSEIQITFVPLASGDITISTTSQLDVKGILYNQNMVKVAEADDISDEDYNFSITYNVEAGKQYTIVIKGATTLTKGDCNVLFDFGGDMGISGTTYTSFSFDVVYDSTFELPTLKKEGYEFLGWFDANGNKITSSTWNFAADTTLYAHWIAIE